MLREIDLDGLPVLARLDALLEPRCAHPWYLESSPSPPICRSAQAAFLRLSAAGSRVFVFDRHLVAELEARALQGLLPSWMETAYSSI